MVGPGEIRPERPERSQASRAGVVYHLSMNHRSFRDMLKIEPFRQFNIKTTDGDTFTVIHRDYAMLSPDEAEAIVYDKDGHFRVIDTTHIVTLEPVRQPTKKSAKR
jgi:hypothetical protein